MSDSNPRLPDPEIAFGMIEAGFKYNSSVSKQDSTVANKLKRYCAFLYFYFAEAEEKYRIFDALRPKLDIASIIKDDDPRMMIWWWAYLDTIVHTSNLYDKPIGSNEPASVVYLDSKLVAWGAELGISEVPRLPDLTNDESLKNLLNLRDKLIIHVEPKYYFEVMLNLRDVSDFFDHLINSIAKPYLESVFDTFFEGSMKHIPRTEGVDNILKLNLKIE